MSLQPDQSQSLRSHPLHPAGESLAASVQEHPHPRLHPLHGHKQGKISATVGRGADSVAVLITQQDILKENSSSNNHYYYFTSIQLCHTHF